MMKIRRINKLCFLVGFITIMFGCNKSTKAVFKKDDSKIQIVDSSKKELTNKEEEMEIDTLIEELNYWAEAGGDPDHPIDNIKSTGESTSAFKKVKQELKNKNIKIKWIDGNYVLDSSNKN